MKLGGVVEFVTRMNWVDFGEDPNADLDTRIFWFLKWFFTVERWGKKPYVGWCFKNAFRLIFSHGSGDTWWRYALYHVPFYSFILYMFSRSYLVLVFDFFSTILNLTRSFAISSLLSLPQSAPGRVLADCIALLHPLIRMSSIWFLRCSSSEIPMYSLRLGCLNHMLTMTCSFCTHRSPAFTHLAHFGYQVHAFLQSLLLLLLHLFSFQSPIIINTSSFGACYTSSCKFP